MKNVIFHPLAEQELIDATAYHEEQKPGLSESSNLKSDVNEVRSQFDCQ